MGGADKLAAEIAGRPAARLDACRARGCPGDRADRRRDVARATRPTSPRHPGCRRASSTSWRAVRAARSRFTRVSSPWSAADPDGRGVVLVHDAARPLMEPALVAAVVEATATPRCGDPGRAGRRDAQADRGRSASAQRSIGHDLGAAQTPQGVTRELLRAGIRPLACRWRRRPSRTRRPCSKPVASRSMSFPAIQAISR